MPALVCTLRNSQRGLTSVISSLVIFKLSFGEMGASLPTRSWAAASNAASPAPANALAMTERRDDFPSWAADWVRDMTNLLYPGEPGEASPLGMTVDSVGPCAIVIRPDSGD